MFLLTLYLYDCTIPPLRSPSSDPFIHISTSQQYDLITYPPRPRRKGSPNIFYDPSRCNPFGAVLRRYEFFGGRHLQTAARDNRRNYFGFPLYKQLGASLIYVADEISLDALKPFSARIYLCLQRGDKCSLARWKQRYKFRDKKKRISTTYYGNT